jgi:hypothetical protein
MPLPLSPFVVCRYQSLSVAYPPLAVAVTIRAIRAIRGGKKPFAVAVAVTKSSPLPLPYPRLSVFIRGKNSLL